MRSHAVYETQAMLDALERDGCALIRDALSETQCARARQMIDTLQPLHWDITVKNAREKVSRLDRYLCVFNRHPDWLQFIDRPGVIDLAQAALGSDCHIIGMTAWRSHPGYAAEPLHVDYLPLPFDAPILPPELRIPIFIMTVQFYLTDVPADLAPTRVVPGSHRAGRAPNPGETSWQGRPSEVVLAGAGDALAFRSDVWHAGSNNRSARDVRYLLQVHYARREMAQHFSPDLEWRFNLDVIAAATQRQRRLLGAHEPGAYD